MISQEDWNSMTSETPTSFASIPPIIRHQQENVTITFSPDWEGYGEQGIKGTLYVTEESVPSLPSKLTKSRPRSTSTSLPPFLPSDLSLSLSPRSFPELSPSSPPPQPQDSPSLTLPSPSTPSPGTTQTSVLASTASSTSPFSLKLERLLLS